MTSDEPQKRIEIVGSQYEIELEVAKALRAAVVFFVPTMLTPLFFNPDDIYFDEKDKLFKLGDGVEVPTGLMPPEKANDPAQLSTVLARVKPMWKMMKKINIFITIVTANMERPQIGNKEADVIPMRNALLKHKDWMNIIRIDQEWFNENKEQIPAASYVWLDNTGKVRLATIFASQICAPDSTAKFDKLFDNDAYLYIDNVNGLLMKMGEPTTDELLANLEPNFPMRANKQRPIHGITA
jgi:hypothetical protein